MNILFGIAIALISYLPASQLWEIYKRERALNELIKDQNKTIAALKSDNFLNEEESAMEQQLKLITADSPYPFRVELFDNVDRTATRRTLFIWGGVWIALLFLLFKIGAGYLIAAVVLAIISGTRNLSIRGNMNALQQYRLILKTFIDWHHHDAQSLTSWIKNNKKYETMVQMVKLHTNDQARK